MCRPNQANSGQLYMYSTIQSAVVHFHTHQVDGSGLHIQQQFSGLTRGDLVDSHHLRNTTYQPTAHYTQSIQLVTWKYIYMYIHQAILSCICEHVVSIEVMELLGDVLYIYIEGVHSRYVHSDITH